MQRSITHNNVRYHGFDAIDVHTLDVLQNLLCSYSDTYDDGHYNIRYNEKGFQELRKHLTHILGHKHSETTAHNDE